MQFYNAVAIAAALGSLVLPATPASSISGHGTSSGPLASAEAKRGVPYTLREQNDQVCDARSRQWTGWIDVSEEKKLFFCK